MKMWSISTENQNLFKKGKMDILLQNTINEIKN